MPTSIGPGHGLGHPRSDVQIRSAAGRRLQGIAAPYNSAATFGALTETIRPGAFSRSLASNPDILCLVDHDPSKLLGRTSAGTLRLRDDWQGLRFEVDLPDTQPANDILALAQRNDLGGMSFAFTCGDNCDLWAGNQRELIDVNLLEVSVISSWPAYSQTTVEARCKGGPCGCSDLRQLIAPAPGGEVERLRMYLETL